VQKIDKLVDILQGIDLYFKEALILQLEFRLKNHWEEAGIGNVIVYLQLFQFNFGFYFLIGQVIALYLKFIHIDTEDFLLPFLLLITRNKGNKHIVDLHL